MNFTRYLTAFAAMFSMIAMPCAAHHVWIEQSSDGVFQLYYGEYAENLKEVAGKQLDRIQPSAILQSSAGDRPVEIARGADGIDLAARPSAGDSLVAEDARYPIAERKVGERTIKATYQPAARFVTDFAARQPKLTLDILPASGAGRFLVTFRGAPLPKAKVNVIAASGWSREVQTDDSGSFGTPLPWKGSYAIEVSHIDRAPSTRDGMPVDVTNFVTTLSFVQPNGFEGLPRPPVAKPND